MFKRAFARLLKGRLRPCGDRIVDGLTGSDVGRMAMALASRTENPEGAARRRAHRAARRGAHVPAPLCRTNPRHPAHLQDQDAHRAPANPIDEIAFRFLHVNPVADCRCASDIACPGSGIPCHRTHPFARVQALLKSQPRIRAIGADGDHATLAMSAAPILLPARRTRNSRVGALHPMRSVRISVSGMLRNRFFAFLTAAKSISTEIFVNFSESHFRFCSCQTIGLSNPAF